MYRRYERIIALIGALLMLLVMVVPAAAESSAVPPPPPQVPFFGMNTYFSGYERSKNDGEDGISALVSRGRAAGAAWGREEMSWANLEPAKGRWNWSWLDKRILQMAQAGYGVTGMLLTTPMWARVSDCKQRAAAAHTEEYWCLPANPRDYADFVWTIIERYDGDGFQDAPGSPRVAAWQIWNEPSARLTWPATPEEYGRMLVEAYKAGKAADNQAIIALGGVYIFDGLGTDPTDGILFYDRMIAAVPESQLTFDALAIHPFMTSAAPDALGIFSTITMWGRVLTAQGWLKAHTRKGEVRPLWLSEIGWAACKSGGPNCPSALTHSEQEPATFMVRAYAVALALGVQQVSYFQLEDKFDGKWGDPAGDAAAILDIKANGYRPKAAYFAYKTMAEQLTNARFLGFGAAHSYRYNPRDQNRNGTYHMRFALPGGARVDLLWRTAGEQNVTIPLDLGRDGALISRDGERKVLHGRSAQITVGEAPLYVRQG
jgi:hypothetical protein